MTEPISVKQESGATFNNYGKPLNIKIKHKYQNWSQIPIQDYSLSQEQDKPFSILELSLKVYKVNLKYREGTI